MLSDFQSSDWNSLTFSGERHHIALRVPGPGAAAVVSLLIDGLDEAEFSIPGQIVADIAIVGPPRAMPDGAIALDIEALTVAE